MSWVSSRHRRLVGVEPIAIKACASASLPPACQCQARQQRRHRDCAHRGEQTRPTHRLPCRRGSPRLAEPEPGGVSSKVCPVRHVRRDRVQTPQSPGNPETLHMEHPPQIQPATGTVPRRIAMRRAAAASSRRLPAAPTVAAVIGCGSTHTALEPVFDVLARVPHATAQLVKSRSLTGHPETLDRSRAQAHLRRGLPGRQQSRIVLCHRFAARCQRNGRARIAPPISPRRYAFMPVTARNPSTSRRNSGPNRGSPMNLNTLSAVAPARRRSQPYRAAPVGADEL